MGHIPYRKNFVDNHNGTTVGLTENLVLSRRSSDRKICFIFWKMFASEWHPSNVIDMLWDSSEKRETSYYYEVGNPFSFPLQFQHRQICPSLISVTVGRTSFSDSLVPVYLSKPLSKALVNSQTVESEFETYSREIKTLPDSMANVFQFFLIIVCKFLVFALAL